MVPETPYGTARKADVETSARKLRQGNRGWEEGLLKRRRVYGGFDFVVHHFFDAGAAVYAWIEHKTGDSIPPEIEELVRESVMAFDRLYPEVQRRAKARPLDGAVYAENTWVLALLLEATGDVEGAVCWLKRTLEFEENPDELRETKLKLAELMAVSGQAAEARLMVAQVLFEAPKDELARALSSRLNPDIPLDP